MYRVVSVLLRSLVALETATPARGVRHRDRRPLSPAADHAVDRAQEAGPQELAEAGLPVRRKIRDATDEDIEAYLDDIRRSWED